MSGVWQVEGMVGDEIRYSKTLRYMIITTGHETSLPYPRSLKISALSRWCRRRLEILHARFFVFPRRPFFRRPSFTPCISWLSHLWVSALIEQILPLSSLASTLAPLPLRLVRIQMQLLLTEGFCLPYPLPLGSRAALSSRFLLSWTIVVRQVMQSR